MENVSRQANQSRSSRGSKFETKVELILAQLQEENKIKSFTRSPSIFNGEFNPDFIIEKNNGEILSIDSTTTARTDRLRGKQWDSYGTKLYFLSEKNKQIKSFVVVDEIATNKRESANFRRCKARCKLPHSSLNGVVSIDELIELITSD